MPEISGLAGMHLLGSIVVIRSKEGLGTGFIKSHVIQGCRVLYYSQCRVCHVARELENVEAEREMPATSFHESSLPTDFTFIQASSNG